MFTGLNSLTKLVITGFKQLTHIFSLPATLEHIELCHNAIDVIEPDAFRHLNKLKHLNLFDNKLTAEKTLLAFAHLANLEHLSLRKNNIDSLEGLKSIHLPRLQDFDLRGCKVTKLSKQTFATLPGLVNLNLGYNEITEIEPGAFDGMSNLRVLNFTDNQLKVFYFNVFDKAVNKIGPPVNLAYLVLDACSIKSVRWSPEKIGLVDESMLKAKEKNLQVEDAAARLFSKCGLRSILDIDLRDKNMNDCSFVVALAARNLVRVTFD
jgi:Leucine-rich repeat (LRR) protein